MKRIVFIILSFIGILCLTGCQKNIEETSELDKIISKNNYIIVDVRTKEEYDESHIKGAINIPYDEIDSNTKLDKSKKILVYCKSGGRSNIAYNTLKELGFDVMDLRAFESIDLEKEQ